MKSDSISDTSVIAEVKDLRLSFDLSAHHAWTLRSQFVEFIESPVRAMARWNDQISVLNGINLTIRKSDRIGVMGRNGAGKTTLARCLCGIYSPERGEVRVHGRARAIFDAGVGFYPELSGRENVQVLLHFLYPHLRSEHAELAEEIFRFSGLGSHLDSRFRVYSKGMQARLGLALVTARPSDLIIVDEIFDGADRFFRDKMSDRFDQFLRKSGAVLFISHSTEQVQEFCNRVIVIEDGRVAFDGGVREGIYFYDRLQPREAEL